MKKINNMDSRERNLFLRSLQEDGIEEVYLSAADGKTAVNAAESALQNEDKQTAVMTEAVKPSSAKEELLELRKVVLQCVLCEELARTRKTVVFGAGNVKAGLMFVGEAPGHDEDVQGLPFVGKAGQLLTKIIESIGLTRQQVFIANTLKCRPPGNRTPRPEEILNCQPFLMKQIELIKPRIICALGNFASQTLLRSGRPVSQLRGKFHDYPEILPNAAPIKVICTYHPAYLLRNPEDKRKVWEDMKMIKKELESPS